MKRFKSTIATLMVFTMVMTNVGLFRAEFAGKGRGTERATFVIMHEPKPGVSFHDPKPGASKHDPKSEL